MSQPLHTNLFFPPTIGQISKTRGCILCGLNGSLPVPRRIGSRSGKLLDDVVGTQFVVSDDELLEDVTGTVIITEGLCCW